MRRGVGCGVSTTLLDRRSHAVLAGVGHAYGDHRRGGTDRADPQSIVKKPDSCESGFTLFDFQLLLDQPPGPIAQTGNDQNVQRDLSTILQPVDDKHLTIKHHEQAAQHHRV